jgi:hypothetical protein
MSSKEGDREHAQFEAERLLGISLATAERSWQGTLGRTTPVLLRPGMRLQNANPTIQQQISGGVEVHSK